MFPNRPRFLSKPDNIVCTEGNATRIDCKVTGRPMPEVTFFLKGYLESLDIYSFFYVHTLKIWTKNANNENMSTNLANAKKVIVNIKH